MLGPVQPTQFDLAFSLFGIPIRVVPTFWLFSAMMGWDYLSDPDHGFHLILIWIAVVFVSILVHELGHAIAAKLFGYPPRIMIYHFGGLAMFTPEYGYSTARAILISLAGPGAGFVLGGCVLVASIVFGISGGRIDRILGETIWMLLWVNIAWSVINLMPVLPLDGGHICRDVCVAMNPHRGISWALWISVIAGGLLGLAMMSIGMFFGIIFLIFALQAYMELQHRRAY
jgi:Zn-dependent protease